MRAKADANYFDRQCTDKGFAKVDTFEISWTGRIMNAWKIKMTRKLTIKDRVIALENLQRLASIIGDQQHEASEAGAHSSASFAIGFADETRIEVDNPSVLSDDILSRPARPVRVDFEFYNYEKGRRINLELRHGSRPWDSSMRIDGEDRAWVDAQFFSLKEVVEAARPQSTLVRRHQSLILHASALGIGTLGQFAIDVLIGTVLVRFGLLEGIQPLGEDSRLREIMISLGPFLYVMLWLWRWLLGLAWGAFAIRSWLLDLWPSVEFSFGPGHHQVELQRRRRLAAIISLVAIPIAIAIAYDLIQYAF